MTARVALVGATGHGAWHLRVIDGLAAAGRVELAALCDVRPVTADVPVYTDHRAMLEAERPDVVVVCTPPHTHLSIASDALRAGSDVLLEKPPTPTLAEHVELAKVVAETGRRCQVGFQALASPALALLLDEIRGGRLGPVTGISAVGARQRPDGYYARSGWAGKRTVDGRPSADGALANVFAHAVMNCLAVNAAAGGNGTLRRVEAELYRCRDIEVDDTAALRLLPVDGPPIVVAVSLCAPEDIDGAVLVHTDSGTAVLEYLTDRLALPGDRAPRDIPGRRSLLENLLDAASDAGALVAPLDRTEPFTRWLEAMRGMPPPTAIPGEHWKASGEGAERRVELAGINDVLTGAAQGMRTFSELGVAWAVPPHRMT